MKYLILGLALLVPLFSQATRCIPKNENCAYYACEEKHRRCGPDGYPLAFGFRFCRAFLNTEKEYSQEAQAWLRKVRLCLQTSFRHVNSDPQKSCRQIRNDSFHEHIGCYESTGFCNLGIFDRWQVIWALRKTIIYPEAIRDGLAVMATCAQPRTEPNPEDQDELR
jgi:hypothetical protein